MNFSGRNVFCRYQTRISNHKLVKGKRMVITHTLNGRPKLGVASRLVSVKNQTRVMGLVRSQVRALSSKPPS